MGIYRKVLHTFHLHVLYRVFRFYCFNRVSSYLRINPANETIIV